MNFSNFQAVDTVNKRTGVSKKREQSFNFRFRKALVKDGSAEDSFFQISNALFAKYDIENRAGRQIVSPEGETFLALVDDENGTFWKQSVMKGEARKKGYRFKSSVIEDALHAAGIIDLAIVGKSQNLELEQVAENVTIGEGEKAFTAHLVFRVTKGAESEDDDTDEEGEGSESTETETATATNEAPATDLNAGVAGATNDQEEEF